MLLSSCYTDGKGIKTPEPQKCTFDIDKIDDWKKRDLGLTPVAGGTLRIREESEPSILLSMFSPHPAIERIINHNVLEPLVKFNAETNKVEPLLAKEWEVENSRIYTFYLNSNARWHDNTPFLAIDVEYTLDTLLDPAGGAINRSRFEDIADVEILDDYTVIITLDEPREDFLISLAQVPILPFHLFNNTIPLSNQYSRAPVGTGPFRFKIWREGHFVELIKNDDWRGEPVFLDSLIYRFVSDTRIALDFFKNGDIDIVQGVSGLTIPPTGWILVHPTPVYNAWIYNIHNPIFKDPINRKAISMLIDKKALKHSIRNCLAKDASKIAISHKTKTALCKGFCLKEAHNLLLSNGWSHAGRKGVLQKKNKPFAFTLLIPDDDIELRRSATVVAHDLQKAGIRMNIAVVSKTIHNERLRTHNFDVTISSLELSMPIQYENLFHTDAIAAGFNFGRFSDPVTDALIDDLKKKSEEINENEVLKKLSNRLFVMEPLTFTFNLFSQILIGKKVRGIELNGVQLETKGIWIEQQEFLQ